MALSKTYLFRGVEYVVTVNTDSENLEVEVEDVTSADQWRASFDSAYIEDLTHKTGNYKQFSIFVSMLESALRHNSESVTLDLLTYSDLESLRSRKGSHLNRSTSSARTSALNTKRYLILTYAVEFDRIHYPLPLSYMGKPDPRVLQETIRQLRQDMKRMKSQGHSSGHSSDYRSLKKEFDLLLQEKEDIETEFVQYKREIQATSKGSAAKEVRILKGVVKNLEEELINEKAKHQRISAKRKQENQELLNELDDLKASERNQRVRIKSLTNELALYRRRGRSSKAQPEPPTRSRGAAAKSSIRRESFIRSAPTSRENSYAKDTSRLSRASAERSRTRPRSYSRERSFENSFESARSAARNRSREREAFRGVTARSRSPSPAGSRGPRFDPTSYIREQQRKKDEAKRKQGRQARTAQSGARDRRHRSSSLGSNRSYDYQRNRNSRPSSVGSNRASSVESLTDIGVLSDASQSSYGRRKVLRPSNNAWSPPPPARRRPVQSKVLSSTPESGRPKPRTKAAVKENRAPAPPEENGYFNRSAEISEIDARLSRLQQFMKSNLQ